MKQNQMAKRHRRSAGRQQEPLAPDPRDPDIVRAHRIARRSGPDAGAEIFDRGAIIPEKRPRGRPSKAGE